MNNKQIAEDIADRLLKNGFGEVGHRLAIRQGPFGLERDLGGWGRDVIVNEVEKILNTKPQTKQP